MGCEKLSAITSESGRAFHVGWHKCAGVTAKPSSAKGKPSAKHDCAKAHPGLGHVRWAIRERKGEPTAAAPAPAKPAGGRKGKRARKAQARANEAGLKANAKAAVATPVGYDTYDKICTEFPGIAGTAWAAYNAVTELATWREGPQADSALMFGIRSQEIQRGYEAAAKLVVAR